MDDKLEVTLRVTLRKSGLRKRFRRMPEADSAFFILGLVHAQLTERYGDEGCEVELESATGQDPAFLRSMSSFARRHKKALDELEAHGVTLVQDRDVVEVLQQLHPVVTTPEGTGWRVVLHGELRGEGAAVRTH